MLNGKLMLHLKINLSLIIFRVIIYKMSNFKIKIYCKKIEIND